MSGEAVESAGSAIPEWGELVDRAVSGDRAAYARLARLVTGYLARWHAYDFRADWEDIVQDVLVSTVAAHREGRFPNSAAFQAYVRQATRFKFVDRIRAAEKRSDREVSEAEAEIPPTHDAALWPPQRSIGDQAFELRDAVDRAIARLDPRERAAVLEVYVRGRTYDEASAATAIPLGTLKRALRTGLARLREVLDGDA